MNGIFYSPNMLQLSKKPKVTMGFGGNNMQEYNEYLNKINNCINNNTIPEIGNFPQVKAEESFKSGDVIVFQVSPSRKDEHAKELSIGFINAKTKQLASITRYFENKTALLEYMDYINKEKLKNMIEGFKYDTEQI